MEEARYHPSGWPCLAWSGTKATTTDGTGTAEFPFEVGRSILGERAPGDEPDDVFAVFLGNLGFLAFGLAQVRLGSAGTLLGNLG